MKADRIVIELDPKSREILERLRGEMSASAFIQLLLKMVDSRAVSAPPTPAPGKKSAKK